MRVSIIITAYNVGKFIERAINSCLLQTHKDIEIIVVEDCSTDNTKELLLNYGDKIKLIEHDANMGAGWGRRHGIEACTGDYFITVDGDDWIDDTFIESLVERAEETGADVVSGGITIERGGGYWEKTCYGDVLTEGEEKVTKFWGEKVVFMNNKIIKRELHDKVPYCTRRFIEDTPTIIPMLWHANMVAYTSDTGYHYRMNDDSLTHKADTFSYALYRGLCAIDLITFFNANDKTLLDKLPMQAMLQQQLDVIKQCKPSVEEINKYMSDWLEFTRRILL